MKKTTFAPGSTQQRWTDMNKMVDDFTALEKNLRDVRTVLSAIAWQQDDKTLTVPVSALQAMPKDIELEVSFDRAHDCYHFAVIHTDGIYPGDRASDAPAAAEGPRLTTDA